MRTLVSTLLVGVCLVASPALAQQNPWVPSGMYTGSLSIGNAHAQASSRIRRGDIVESSGWRTGKPAKDELYNDSCNSSHSVFSCPGTL